MSDKRLRRVMPIFAYLILFCLYKFGDSTWSYLGDYAVLVAVANNFILIAIYIYYLNYFKATDSLRFHWYPKAIYLVILTAILQLFHIAYSIKTVGFEFYFFNLNKELASNWSLFMPLYLFERCVSGPIVEEMLFRGIFMTSYFKNSPYYLDLIFSSFLFGLAHESLFPFVVDVPHLIFRSVLGLGMGILFRKTKCLHYSMATHIILNTLVYTPPLAPLLRYLL